MDQGPRPGQLVANGVGPCDDDVRIVAPFLTGEVEPGQQFWLLLYPGTITGLRHVWTHLAFQAAAAAVREKLS